MSIAYAVKVYFLELSRICHTMLKITQNVILNNNCVKKFMLDLTVIPIG